MRILIIESWNVTILNVTISIIAFHEAVVFTLISEAVEQSMLLKLNPHSRISIMN